jgi:hypothetical protein
MGKMTNKSVLVMSGAAKTKNSHLQSNTEREREREREREKRRRRNSHFPISLDCPS